MTAILIDREAIKARIRELGFTYAGVARRAEISVYTLNKIVSPAYGIPHAYTRKRLARALEISEDVLFPPVDAGEEEAS